MRTLLLASALVLTPGAAFAQSHDEPAFGGVKIGASIDYRWLDGDFAVPRIAGKVDEKKGGIGVRGHAGYDVQLGSTFLVGVEGGIGRGGEKLTTSNTTGDYTLKPRWTWDVSGRVGVLPTSNVLLYGRAGYSWLRARETTDFHATNLKDLKSNGTEKGFLWGAGAEAALAPGFYARAEYNRVNYRDGLTASKVLLGLSMGF